jgi:hypothetical protein
VAQDDDDAVAPRDADAARSANRGGENEVADAFEPKRLPARFAGGGFETREDVLIVPQKTRFRSHSIGQQVCHRRYTAPMSGLSRDLRLVSLFPLFP